MEINSQYCWYLFFQNSNRNVSKEQKKQATDDERIRNCIEGKFGQGKRRFSLGKVMAKLPHTSFSAIAITFLVMNLSNLLRQVFWAFLCPMRPQLLV